MKPYYDEDGITIYHGDCRDVLPTLGHVESVITSPPYAEQRQEQYGGINEDAYPDWWVEWMGLVPLAASGSVVVNIRPHIRAGVVSDYVLRGRVALVDAGWVQCEELIWYKPDAAPFGSSRRPRRAWESLLWFGRTGDVWSDPKAVGTPAKRSVAYLNTGWKGMGDYIAAHLTSQNAGDPTRTLDVVSVKIAHPANVGSGDHPAPYPLALAKWLVGLVSPPRSTVLDPFMGSGTTLRAAKDLGRRAIGIEIEERYCEIAVQRLAQGVLSFDG